jgi:hypothetical protein
MRDEALNTNDYNRKRTWMEDRRSTLRHQMVSFVEGGLLNNKPPTPAITESEAESSQSASEHKEEEKIITKEAVMTNVPTQSKSTARMASASPDGEAQIEYEMELSQDESPIATDGTSIPESSISTTKRTVSSISHLTPLPPVQFISTQENIVFVPRNQRPSKPTQLPNWDVSASLKTLTESAPSDWTKPRKRRGGKRGQKFFVHTGEPEADELFVERSGSGPRSAAEEALMDYLENIRAQSDNDEEDESFLERMLKVVGEVDVDEAMGELSLDEKRSRSVKRKAKPSTGAARFASSEPTTPVRVGTSEDSGLLNLAALSELEEDPTVTPLVRGTKGNDWIVERPDSEEEISAGNSGEEDYWVDEEDEDEDEEGSDFKAKGKSPAIEISDEEQAMIDDEEEEDDDSKDEDEELEEDEDIIANMILDDYDLDDLDLDIDFPSTLFRRSRKSLTRQPDVPALPSNDGEIMAHLQNMWKKDRSKKKARKEERERARLLGLLGNKTKSKCKKTKRGARREELERINALEGMAEINMQKINEDIRAFWEDTEALEYFILRLG